MYSSTKAHLSPVIDLAFAPEMLISVSAEAVQMHAKGLAPMATFRSVSGLWKSPRDAAAAVGAAHLGSSCRPQPVCRRAEDLGAHEGLISAATDSRGAFAYIGDADGVSTIDLKSGRCEWQSPPRQHRSESFNRAGCPASGTLHLASLPHATRGAPVSRCRVSRRATLDRDVSFIRGPVGRGLVVTGSSQGGIAVRDPRGDFRALHSLDAHNGGLSSLSVHGDLVATCGLMSRAGRISSESIVRVFDCRMNLR